MILYVFIIWISAAFLFIALEYLIFSFEAAHQTGLPLSVPSAAIQGQILNQQTYSLDIFLCFSLALLCFIFAYMSEVYLKLISRTYQALQKSYPSWYQRISAPWREIYISLGFGLVASLICMGVWLWFLSWQSAIYLTFVLVGLGLGWLLVPLLKYRTSLVEDRPETPPEALLQKMVDYPQRSALVIGQVYLRFLMPFLTLFLLLLLPVFLQKIVLSNRDFMLLLGAIIVGITIGWACVKESHLYVENFKENLLALLGVVLLAGALLLFGVYSNNMVVLLAAGASGGFFVSTY